MKISFNAIQFAQTFRSLFSERQSLELVFNHLQQQEDNSVEMAVNITVDSINAYQEIDLIDYIEEKGIRLGELLEHRLEKNAMIAEISEAIRIKASTVTHMSVGKIASYGYKFERHWLLQFAKELHDTDCFSDTPIVGTFASENFSDVVVMVIIRNKVEM